MELCSLDDQEIIQSYYAAQRESFKVGRSIIIEGFRRIEMGLEALIQQNNKKLVKGLVKWGFKQYSLI